MSRSTDSLPQLCKVCRKQKLATLGKFHRSKTRYNGRYWVCDACADKKRNEVPRLCRKRFETPPEREVRMALADCEYGAYSEYSLGPFIYDFAVPKIRLLIEVDSKTYHRGNRKLARDREKDALARREGWAIVRVRADHPDMVTLVLRAINRRAELFE